MPHTRPATIAELAEEALDNPWDPSKELKYYLRQAERFRKTGKELTLAGDLESAFVQFAKAATLVLEKLPTHKDYNTILSKQQRYNLSLNGQDILDSLSDLKPILLSQYEKWHSRHPDDTTTPNGRHNQAQRHTPEDSHHRQMVAEEVYKWKQQREGGYVVDPRQSHQPSTSQANPPAPAARKAMSQSQPSTSNHAHFPMPQVPDMRRMHDESSRRLEEPPRHYDLSRRQGDEAARTVQQRLAGHNGLITSNASIYHQQATQPVPYTVPQVPEVPRAPPASAPAAVPASGQEVPILQMPLERPGNDADSTDSESVLNGYSQRRPTPFVPPAKPQRRDDYRTTSSAPQDNGPISYPKIMSQHQRTQGYIPSTIFQPLRTQTGSSAMFFQDPKQPLYSNLLPPPSSAPPPQRQPLPAPQPSHAIAPRKPPPVPAAASGMASPDIPPPPDGLKTVHLPRECFVKFLAIASINTSRNKETCGLLLGRPKGHKYIVSTLLIPKQHSTSDTCTMDEEELVLQFTEERSLITLGWIHTHPSQSCFMSSVDLHTHSGFQRMLPESFAVVCAPKSDPSVGIFRLTDPPGLKTILDCDAKESFHPHPDLPIYTDADRGHVQMKDLPLEIVDIRG